MQHRFAYVGQDLQDMYGIDPTRIANATSIADAYFADGDARATLARLAATPDGVLVSHPGAVAVLDRLRASGASPDQRRFALPAA